MNNSIWTEIKVPRNQFESWLIAIKKRSNQ
jgi:hypothetical protein